MKRLVLSSLLVAVMSVTAVGDDIRTAVDIEGFGGGGGGDGTADTSELVAEVMFSLPDIDSFDGVIAELSHSFQGDITLEVVDPLGAVHLIIEGDGPAGNTVHQNSASRANDLGLVAGDGTLANVAEYRIVNDGVSPAWNDAGNTNSVAAGTYTPTGTGIGTGESFPAGSYAAGTWTLRLYDSWDTADTGSVGDLGVSFTTASVPEPTTVALLGVLGLGLVSRRRRK